MLRDLACALRPRVRTSRQVVVGVLSRQSQQRPVGKHLFVKVAFEEGTVEAAQEAGIGNCLDSVKCRNLFLNRLPGFTGSKPGTFCVIWEIRESGHQ